MNCKHCGAEVEDGAELCPQCGSPPDETPEIPAEETVTEETAEENVPEENAPEEETSEENTSEEDILSRVSEWIPETPEETAGSASAEETGPARESPAPAEPAKRKEPLWLFIILGLAAAAAVAVLIFWLVRGNKDKNVDIDESPSVSSEADPAQPGSTEPDSLEEPSTDAEPAETYTVPNEEITADMAAAAAASCGGQELSNTELSYYYWNQFYSWANAYGDYLSYFLDINTPLSEQSYPDDPERSWESFLLDAALETFHQTTAIVKAAEQAGFAIDAENAEYLKQLPDTLASNAALMDMDSADEFLQSLYGPYADTEGYTKFVSDSLVSYGYLNELFAAIEYRPEDIETWFDENQEKFEEMGLSKDEPNMVNVRHILINPTASGEADETGETELTDQDWSAARERAEALLAEWKAGEATEDSFALLASENTEDPGSKGTGGLYEGVYPGEMVAAFNDWCFEEGRKPGDTGIVETEYGYHVMYFSARQDHAHWYEMAEQDYLTGRQQEILDGLTADCPLQTNYDKIVLMESNALQ